VESSFNGASLLIFGLLPPRPAESLPESAPTDEATEWFVVTEPTRLCFPTHTEAMGAFFVGRGPLP
jgi:hypothetical protein